MIRAGGQGFTGFFWVATCGFAMAEREEGPLMSANIVDCPAHQLEIGMPLVPVFAAVDDGIALIKFRPA